MTTGPARRCLFRAAPALLRETFFNSPIDDPKRIELLLKRRKLVLTADDGAIEALLSNVDQFQSAADARRELEELKKK